MQNTTTTEQNCDAIVSLSNLTNVELSERKYDENFMIQINNLEMRY